MVRFGLLVAVTALVTCVQAFAAPVGGGSPSAPVTANPGQSSNPYDAEVQRRLQNEILLNKRKGVLTPEEKAKQKAQDIADASAVVTSLQLSCTVSDANMISSGKMKLDGTDVMIKNYEVACGNGMGYLLVSQDPKPPTGFSCFAAEGQREAMAAKGQKFDDVCQLPANADVKAMAGKVMAGIGTACTVDKLQWFGQSTANKKDYVEVACTNGRGYLLATPIPGSSARPAAIDCVTAATHGFKCAMTATAALPPPQGTEDKPTAEMLKAALAQHNVVCSYTNMRVIGRETARKRHVVEYACPEHPKGLVAFIPLGSNTNPFEALDCATAAKRGVVCTLTPAK